MQNHFYESLTSWSIFSSNLPDQKYKEESFLALWLKLYTFSHSSSSNWTCLLQLFISLSSWLIRVSLLKTEPQPKIKPNDPPLAKTEIGIAANLLVWTADQTPIIKPKSPPTMKPIMAPLSMLTLADSIDALSLLTFLANFEDLSISMRFCLYFYCSTKWS